MRDRSHAQDLIKVSQGCLLFFKSDSVHRRKWSEISHNPSSDGTAKPKCMRGYYSNPWAWRSTRWYDAPHPQSHTEYKTRKCSYPIPGSYDQETTSKENQGSRSTLDSSLHRPRKLRCWITRHDRSSRLVGGTMGNFRYAALVIFIGRRNWGKTRKDRDSQYCDSIWDKDYNTMSLTYTSPAVYDEWSWILWLIDERQGRHDPSHSAPNSYLIFYLQLFSRPSSWDPPQQFSRLTSWFACKKPTSRSSC